MYLNPERIELDPESTMMFNNHQNLARSGHAGELSPHIVSFQRGVQLKMKLGWRQDRVGVAQGVEEDVYAAA